MTDYNLCYTGNVKKAFPLHQSTRGIGYGSNKNSYRTRWRDVLSSPEVLPRQKPDNERKKDSMALDPPNYRTAMKAFRLCVQRYGRLPQELVADRSPESGKKSSDPEEWLDMREVVGGERK